MTAGGILILLLLILAICPGVIAPYDPIAIRPSEKLSPPSRAHLFGTDALGRDIFSRVVWGTRISIIVGFTIVSMAMAIGSLLGATAGYFGGTIDQVIMRIVDVLIAIPVLVLAMVLSAAMGAGLTSAVIAMIIVFCPRYVRLIRGQVLSVRNELYTEGARAIGASHRHIITYYIMRNSFDPVIIKATLDVGHTIMYTAALGFIGLGATPPTPEWGAMISHSRAYIISAWWYTTFPGAAIVLTVLAWNLFGDGLREILNPEERKR
jgi:peptide/nickel transport system permease protein